MDYEIDSDSLVMPIKNVIKLHAICEITTTANEYALAHRRTAQITTAINTSAMMTLRKSDIIVPSHRYC